MKFENHKSEKLRAQWNGDWLVCSEGILLDLEVSDWEKREIKLSHIFA